MGGRIQSVFSLFIATLLLASVTAQAEEALFCRDAYKAICDKSTVSGAGETVEAFNNRTAAEARERAKVFPIEERWLGALTLFEGLIYRRLRISRGDLDVFFEETRQALQKTLTGMREIPSATKSSMRKALARQSLMTASEYVEEFGGSEAVDLSLTCGLSGIAGLTMASSGRDVVVLCPGAASLLHEGFNAKVRLKRLISHELGHAINSTSYPSVFARFGTCLAGADPLTDEMFSEITADWWGISAATMSLAQKELPGPLVVDELRSTFAVFCGTRESPPHPSGRYRIQTILGTHPGIRELVGCEEVIQPDACTLKGPAKRKKLLGLF